jgi:hypothetical protein
LQLGDDWGFTTIKDVTTATNETFVLWYAPKQITEFTRVLQSMWVSLLRQAMANSLQVTIGALDGSAQVASVQLMGKP